ncbi:MAG: transglutaminase-like domain-containing protein [Bacteroidota bacterium]
MIEKEQLPHILNLVDDEAEEVRNHVFKDLTDYGLDLENDLFEFADIIDKRNLDIIDPIIKNNRRKWLKNNWSIWFNIVDEFEKIESVMSLISKFQLGYFKQIDLSRRLDQISEDFKNRYPYGNELDLANYLFKVLDLRGDKQDYYSPYNSNLYYSLEEGKGLPITLALIFILIGERLGFNVSGCNFPGHFMAKAVVDGEVILIDCFNNGRIIFESELKDISDKSHQTILKIVHSEIDPDTIIKRVLRNLINAYKEKKDSPNLHVISELLTTTPWK